jgi:hypothetical protein
VGEADLLAEIGALDSRIADDSRAFPPAEQEADGRKLRVELELSREPAGSVICGLAGIHFS